MANIYSRPSNYRLHLLTGFMMYWIFFQTIANHERMLYIIQIPDYLIEASLISLMAIFVIFGISKRPTVLDVCNFVLIANIDFTLLLYYNYGHIVSP